LGLPQVKIKYVLNGIVVDKQERCSGCASQDNHEILADSPIRIGIVGQVEEWKGHEDLIDALHILDRKDEPFLCRIFGADNSAFALRLKSRIEEYGLTDNVEWVGFVANKNLIYDAIDVCVAPSRFQEPFGMVAAEAALHGLPVIASRVGGFPEVIINEQTGYLVDAKCPEQIAEKIRVLLASPAKRVEMGMRARTYVESSLGADKMIERMETIITELAQGKLLEEPN
jgi:glycosyltransferase involved in cell wall biosynthesis